MEGGAPWCWSALRPASGSTSPLIDTKDIQQRDGGATRVSTSFDGRLIVESGDDVVELVRAAVSEEAPGVPWRDLGTNRLRRACNTRSRIFSGATRC